jgi:hypothetical protein
LNNPQFPTVWIKSGTFTVTLLEPIVYWIVFIGVARIMFFEHLFFLIYTENVVVDIDEANLASYVRLYVPSFVPIFV